MTARDQPASARRDLAGILFLTLLGSYAFFWQARCWNSATRLMLTYALGDRGTLCIDGLEGHTRDRALVGGHFYCDKAPGQSLLAVPVYLLANLAGAYHPLGMDESQLRYWWPDYLVTVATSGVSTAGLGVLVYVTAIWLGCNPLAAVVVALSYGLGTPAFTYATLFYGHQSAAFFAYAAFMLLWRNQRTGQWTNLSMLGAGLLAGLAGFVEYPLALVAAGLAVFAIWASRRPAGLVPFMGAGTVWMAVLALYHAVVFGGPFQLGYFYETESQFRQIYSADHPIGLQRPSLRALAGILASPHGLLLFAPVTSLALFGLPMLVRRGNSKLLFLVLWSFGSLLLLNASHPTWTGGYATGPRYLLPVVPFLMIPIAALVVGGGRVATAAAALLGLLGFAIVGCCTAYGGRLPDLGLPGGDNPFLECVLPALRDGQFDRNAGKLLLYPWWSDLPPRWRPIALVPLLAFLAGMIWLLVRRATAAPLGTVLSRRNGVCDTTAQPASK